MHADCGEHRCVGPYAPGADGGEMCRPRTSNGPSAGVSVSTTAGAVQLMSWLSWLLFGVRTGGAAIVTVAGGSGAMTFAPARANGAVRGRPLNTDAEQDAHERIRIREPDGRERLRA
jgi:hypothetical protein